MTSPVEEIAAMMGPRAGLRPWYERLDGEQAALVAEILAGWKSGKFGTARRTAAKAISAYLSRNGIAIGHQGVDSWLQKHPVM